MLYYGRFAEVRGQPHGVISPSHLMCSRDETDMPSKQLHCRAVALAPWLPFQSSDALSTSLFLIAAAYWGGVQRDLG